MRAEMNFAALPDPVATARGSDTVSKHLGYAKAMIDQNASTIERIVSRRRKSLSVNGARARY